MTEKRRIVVDEVQTVDTLAALLKVSQARLVSRALHDLGWMITRSEQLPWQRAEALASAYGVSLRRGPDYPDEDNIDHP